MNTKPDKPLFGFMTRNYLVLTLTSSLWGFAASITNTYFSLYVFQLGGTETIIGLILALGSASYVIFAIIGGHIADLYGRKRLLGLMTLAAGASQLLTAVAPNWQFLAMAIVVVNICWIMEPAFWAMLADSISEEKRGVAFSIFSCINFLPWAIMPFIGGYLIDTHGLLTTMRIAYVALAIFGVISGAIRLSMLKETITTPNRENQKINLKNMGKFVKESFKEHFDIWLSMPYATLALAITYIIWSFYGSTYSSLEADLVPMEKRGRVFAAFSVAWSAFSIPASLVGGIIYEQVNPQLSFILAATVVILCFITTTKFIHIPAKTNRPKARNIQC